MVWQKVKLLHPSLFIKESKENNAIGEARAINSDLQFLKKNLLCQLKV